jgi:hypothetical protein
MTIYCLHLFQGVLAIFFGTMGAESTWNFKKKVLLVFEVGSFWQFFRIFSLFPRVWFLREQKHTSDGLVDCKH